MTRLNQGVLTSATGSTNAITLGSLNVGATGNLSGIQTATPAAGAMVAPAVMNPIVPNLQAQTQSNQTLQGSQLLGTIDCTYEDVFKEITKKLYGDESGALAMNDVLDPSILSTVNQPIVYDTGELFRQDTTGTIGANAGSGLALVTAPGTNGIAPGAIIVQRRIQDDKGRIWTIEGLPNTGEQIAFASLVAPASGELQTTATHVPQMELQQAPPLQQHLVVAQPQQVQTTPQTVEERWFESDEDLSWTQSRIARYNPSQRVFRCADCDFVGFLSRVAEHWLGNHADLRVFHCPRCPYTSAWARCVRMHLTRQHGETQTDNSLWKENPVLEEVTKYLNTLKTKVEQKNEPAPYNGEKRYTCPYCTYQTDRRDLYNRHENIHRDEKPFQCYVCDKQFNRADHVKKHFIRMHREHAYDINKIKKTTLKAAQVLNANKIANKQRGHHHQQNRKPVHQSQESQSKQQANLLPYEATGISGSTAQQEQSQSSSLQQVPQLLYFNSMESAGQSGQSGLSQRSQGMGGTKKETKVKGFKKKRSSEKMYTCSYCPWQGVDNWCLKRHLNTHIKPFLCALCDYKAARSERLATHVLKVHNKRVCHKCSFLADDMESLGRHNQDSHQNPLVKTGFNCNICQEYFELRADLEAHAILEHQKVIVQCDLCDFRTTDELSMEAHLRDKHNLTPGMGAVAAAAAAAAAAAVGQPGNMQFTQSEQSEPQSILPDDSEHLLPRSVQVHSTTQNQDRQIASTSQVEYTSATSNLHIAKVVGGSEKMLGASQELSEPETLCDKCGIDFVDEESRKLHEQRHNLVNLREDENKRDGETVSGRRLIRNYVCSTCSYTSATKKIMMQHQRAHTGFELVCMAEKCLFSTPFENTLKEHIQNDHGSEEHARCPHCGLRMESSGTFTSHWRFHHRAVCSLCVNIYRVKYDMKENDIHDVTCKPPNSATLDIDTTNDHLQFRMQSTDFANNLTDLTFPSLDFPVESSAKLEQETVVGSNCSTAILYQRESISLLPRLVEVIVAPVPGKLKQHFTPRGNKRKTKSRRKVSRNINNTATKASTILSRKIHKKIDLMLNVIHRKDRKRRNGFEKVSYRRRYCQKGTYAWLFRNAREGFKCVSPLCRNRLSWRYPTKAGLALHKIWYHERIPRFECDICGLQFFHMYKVILHKRSQHNCMELSPVKDQSVNQLPTDHYQQHAMIGSFNETHLIGDSIPAIGSVGTF